MPVKRKLSAFAVFAVSLIAIGTGIGGMYIRVVLLSNIDQTWWLAKLAMMVYLSSLIRPIDPSMMTNWPPNMTN